MNKKSIVRKYILPNYWVLIVGVGGFILGITLITIGGEEIYGIAFSIMMLTVIPFIIGLFGILPGIFHTAGTLKRLKKAGVLAVAEEELSGNNVKEMCKKKVACTEHFLFARRGAYACAYTDILWTHKGKHTTRFFLIPIHTDESVTVYTQTKAHRINLGGKDKKNELTELITTIYRHNPNVLVGFTPENKKVYKQMTRSRK